MLLSWVPPPASLSEYALLRGAMGTIATWVFFPSLAVTLIAGLLAIAFHRGFHNAGWAWLKAATGILIFEGGFVGVIGPMQREAERSAKALAGQKLGIKEVDDGIWIVSFMRYDLGYIDLEQRTLQTIDNPLGTRLSPMSRYKPLPMSPVYTQLRCGAPGGIRTHDPRIRNPITLS